MRMKRPSRCKPLKMNETSKLVFKPMHRGTSDNANHAWDEHGAQGLPRTEPCHHDDSMQDHHDRDRGPPSILPYSLPYH